MVAELALVVEASAAAILAVAAASVALLVAALGPHQLSTAVAFEEHRLSVTAGHTLRAEALAGQVPDLGSIMVAIACLRCGRRDSVDQSVDPQGRTSAGPLQLLGNQTA